MNIVEIARCIGVSKSTVWRAINNSNDISPDTREKVLLKLEEFGYQPNYAARALVTGKTKSILVWMACLDEQVYAQLLHYLESLFAREKREMIVRSRRSFYLSGLSEPADLMRWPVEGIIAWDVVDIVELIKPYLKKKSGASTPIVSFGSYYDTTVDAVGIDFYTGAKTAVRHLIEMGYKNIIYLVNDYFNNTNDPRCKGYIETMCQEGLQPCIIPNPNPSRSGALQTIQDWVRIHGHPDALFCFNDEQAIGAYRGLRDMGLRIPEDVAIVGCDGIEDTEYLDCPLSTLVQPFQEACEIAWHFLTNRMENPQISRQFTLLQPQLVVRASSMRQGKKR